MSPVRVLRVDEGERRRSGRISSASPASAKSRVEIAKVSRISIASVPGRARARLRIRRDGECQKLERGEPAIGLHRKSGRDQRRTRAAMAVTRAMRGHHSRSSRCARRP